MPRGKLNARQRLLVQEYVWGDSCGNGAACAKLAGYKDAEAAHAAYQVLRKPHVKALVDKELAEKRELVKQRMLSSLERQVDISVAKPTDILNAEGKLKPFDQWPAYVKLAVASIEVEDLYVGSGTDRKHIGVVRKIKFHDPTPAARLAAQWSGELKETIKIDPDGITLDQLVPRRKPEPAPEKE